MSRRLLAWAAALCLFVGAPALAADAEDVRGLIHSIAPDGRSVSLSHDPIPDIGWPAMTMDLGLAETADLAGIAPDSVVLFSLSKGADGIYQIESIRLAPDQSVRPEAAAESPGAMAGMAGMGHDHNMTLDTEGMVMNANAERLPEDCGEVSEDVEFTVRAGRKYAAPYPGTAFGYDRNQFQVAPCARVTVTLINDDEVRHQWMLHGLPRYLYPQGMFHLELFGRGQKTGSFIVPSTPATYLIHCDLPQHMEKGMKAQLLVGPGAGDLAAIPGLTAPRRPDRYATPQAWLTPAAAAAIFLISAGLTVAGLRRWR